MKVHFAWTDDQPDHPAHTVVLRLIGLTDEAIDSDGLDRFVMRQVSPDAWALDIDLPAELRTSYQFCPLREGELDRPPSDEQVSTLLATGVPDPTVAEAIGPCSFGNSAMASVLALPAAPPEPWTQPRAVRRGTVAHIRYDSGWPDGATTYTAAGATANAPLVILFDGRTWLQVGATTVFDNLVADGAVPPFVAVLVDYPMGPRRVEGLTNPDRHLRYLTERLLPSLGRRIDPRQTVLVGQSLGGLAAVHAAASRPDLFGNVLTQSGAFWWPGPGLVGDEVIEAPLRDVRLWCEVGRFEGELLEANRRLRSRLEETGVPYEYREFCGGHDFACWRLGLADGLVGLLAS